MSKKQAIAIIIFSVLIGWFFNIFAGRFLAAKLSTWPLLNKWGILSPGAPIVITNNQTVRVSDSGDAAQAIAGLKSKISSLVLVSGNSDVFAGTAVNLTSDGSFVTAAGSFGNKAAGDYYVVLGDGTMAKVTQTATDTATSLVFFKAQLSGVPVPGLGSSKDMSVGDKVLFIQNSMQNFNVKAIVSAVDISQSDVSAQVFQSDYPSRSFDASADSSLANGEALANINGEIVGVWNGSNIISSDVLKNALALYFNDQQKIIRPAFGFSYSVITKSDSQLAGLPRGALVKAVAANSPAHQAGLAAGDVITSVNGQATDENTPLEEILEKYKPGDQISLAVSRKNQAINLSLTAGELK